MSRVERESRSVWWLSLAPGSGTADASVCVALAGGGHGVSVFSQDGVETAFIEMPEPLCTRLCFLRVDVAGVLVSDAAVNFRWVSGSVRP